MRLVGEWTCVASLWPLTCDRGTSCCKRASRVWHSGAFVSKLDGVFHLKERATAFSEQSWLLFNLNLMGLPGMMRKMEGLPSDIPLMPICLILFRMQRRTLAYSHCVSSCILSRENLGILLQALMSKRASDKWLKFIFFIHTSHVLSTFLMHSPPTKFACVCIYIYILCSFLLFFIFFWFSFWLVRNQCDWFHCASSLSLQKERLTCDKSASSCHGNVAPGALTGSHWSDGVALSRPGWGMFCLGWRLRFYPPTSEKDLQEERREDHP